MGGDPLSDYVNASFVNVSDKDVYIILWEHFNNLRMLEHNYKVNAMNVFCRDTIIKKYTLHHKVNIAKSNKTIN